MTDKEVLDETRRNSNLNIARIMLCAFCEKIEREHLKQHPMSGLEMRRVEFDAVRKIAAVLGVKIPE